MLQLDSHTKSSVTKRTIGNPPTVHLVSLLCVGMFLVSCTQANNGNITTGQTSSPSTPQDQLPPAVAVLVQESGIGEVYADTDGNGVDDRIERCGPASICIYLIDKEGQESPPHTYNNPDWETVSIEQVDDVDNLPGNEVIVKTTTIGGNFGCVCIITARDHSMTRYADPSWFAVTVESLSDTDGSAGLEIILSVTNARGEFHCICVLHPSSGSYETYRDAKWEAVTIQFQGDTDGLPGAEIILDVRDGHNNLVCICVIHDRSTTTTVYRDPMWTSPEVNAIVDTDGRPGTEIILEDTDGHPGAEIVLVFRGSTTAGVSVIHDQTKELNLYQFSDVFVEMVSDRDTFPGSEICLLVPTSRERFIIRDRTKEQEVIETCE